MKTMVYFENGRDIDMPMLEKMASDRKLKILVAGQCDIYLGKVDEKNKHVSGERDQHLWEGEPDEWQLKFEKVVLLEGSHRHIDYFLDDLRYGYGIWHFAEFNDDDQDWLAQHMKDFPAF